MTRTLHMRIAATACVLFALIVSYTGLLDHRAQNYSDATLKRALVTFAVARTLNGVISVAQETEVALRPAGVGVSLSPGELLDPINDLIERFSWVMLVSTTSIGVQQFMLKLSAWWTVDVVLTLSAVALLAAIWFERWPGPWRARVFKISLAALLIRFAIPVLLLVTSAVSSAFLQHDQVQITSELEMSAHEVRTLTTEPQDAQPTEKLSLRERAARFVERNLPSVDVEERIESIRENLNKATGAVVTLTASFVLETILVPLGVLWIFSRLVRAAGALFPRQ